MDQLIVTVFLVGCEGGVDPSDLYDAVEDDPPATYGEMVVDDWVRPDGKPRRKKDHGPKSE